MPGAKPKAIGRKGMFISIELDADVSFTGITKESSQTAGHMDWISKIYRMLLEVHK